MPDYNTRLQLERNLLEKYSFIKRELVGKSLCNREIYAYTIGSGNIKTLYAGAFHGMEWLTSLVLIKFLEECCEALDSNKNILNFRIADFLKTNSLTIIPCINPDGVEIQQKGSSSCHKFKRLIDFIATDTSHWQALRELQAASLTTQRPDLAVSQNPRRSCQPLCWRLPWRNQTYGSRRSES